MTILYMLSNNQFYLLIGVMIIIIVYNYRHNREGYDGKISKSTDTECGNICTKTIGCAGFGFDTETNTCYISKWPVYGQPPFASLYSGDYTTKQRTCTKREPIKVPDNITPRVLFNNSIYTCGNDQQDTLKQTQYINNSKIEKPIETIDTSKYSTTISDNTTAFIDSKYELQTMTFPSSKIDIDRNNDIKPYALTEYHTFKRDQDNEYIGQYMYPYKCVQNVKLDKCLRDCSEKSDCKGVEFITSRDNHHNICCPKREIYNVVSRDEKHRDGAYYMKTNDSKFDMNNIYIKL